MKSWTGVKFLIVLTFTAGCLSIPLEFTESFYGNTIENVRTLLGAKGKDGLEEIYYKVLLQEELKKFSSNKNHEDLGVEACKLIPSFKAYSLETLQSEAKEMNLNTYEMLFYALALNEKLKCSFPTEKIFEQVQAKLSDVIVDVEDVYWCARTLELKKSLFKAMESVLVPLVEQILELKEADGTFLKSIASEEGTTFYAALAYKTLGIFKRNGLDVQFQKIQESFEAASSLFLHSEKDGNSIYFTDFSIDEFTVTTAVVEGIFDFGLNHVMTNDQVIGILNFLHKFHGLKSSGRIYHLLHCLELFAFSTMNKTPLLLVRLDSSFASQASSSYLFKLRAVNLLGQPLYDEGINITVTAAKVPHIVNQPMERLAEDKSIFYLTVATTKLEPGRQELLVNAKGDKYIDAGGKVFSFNIFGKGIESVKLDIALALSATPPDFDLSANVHLAYPGEGAAPIALSLGERQFYFFKVVAKKANDVVVRLHQNFLRLKSKKFDISVASSVQMSKSFDVIMLSHKSLSSLLHNTSDTYAVSLLLGDPFMEEFIEWEIGTLKVEFEVADEETGKKDATELISYNYQELPKRPGKQISRIFTFLAFSPLFVLIISLFVFGLPMKNMSGGQGVLSFLLVALITAILLFVAYYFICMSFLESIRFFAPMYFVLIVVVVIVMGRWKAAV